MFLNREIFSSYIQYSVNTDKRNMLEDLTSNLISKPNNKAKLMYEVAACISAAVDADDFNLYIHETEGQITLFSPQEEKAEAGPRSQQIRSGTSIAAHCAKVKDIIKTSLGVRDPRFPLGVSGWPPTAKVLCHPVCSEDEDIEAVLEFVKDGKGNSFTEEDIEVGHHHYHHLLKVTMDVVFVVRLSTATWCGAGLVSTTPTSTPGSTTRNTSMTFCSP